MKTLLTILMFFYFCIAYSQQNNADPENDVNTDQLEDLNQEEDQESENDYDLQQLKYFSRHPLDINGTELEQLSLLDPLLISNLLSYRNLLGDIIDIHELQAVPGFTIELIKKIIPYVVLKKDKPSITSLRERFSKGDYSVLVRPTFIPEVSEGFNSSSGQKFTGSRPAMLFRYKYQFRNLLQYGFVADKDAGEKLFMNGWFPDFISFHLFARRIGIFKSIALGDYTINLGQGLIHWQSQAFRKSSSVINIKRQSDVLRPYHSAGEYNFLRGVAATITLRKTECTIFYSAKKITANIDDEVITSVITSGLHRTQTELDDNKSASLITAGINIKRILKSGYIGLNALQNTYSIPIWKQDEPYNLYSLRGKQFTNISTDYSYTFRNFHLFGELATSKQQGYAIINGVMVSLSQTVDLALLHRKISKTFQSVFGNAFTENSMPVNEHGFYSGVSLKANAKWKIDLYADLFTFPWLKYRLDAPSYGLGYLVQVTFKPNKQTEIYSRFRYRLKPLNIENEEEDFKSPGIQEIQNWRTQLSRQVSSTLLIRSRTEVCIFYHQYLQAQQTGYLFYADLVYKPFSSWFSGNIRFQVFEAENYDTRIYAFENDLLFASSTPSFYNNGVRCYLNLKARLRIKFLNTSQLTLNVKAASTVYKNISSIGTGPALIPGNRISSIRLQIFLSK